MVDPPVTNAEAYRALATVGFISDRQKATLLSLADLCEADTRLIQISRRLLVESRELLARVNSLLAAPVATKTSSLTKDALRNAVERVFDRRTDERASPVPQSTSIH